MTQTQHTQADPKDEYAGTPYHIWQSLFVFVSMIRPEWPIDRIADSTFSARREHAFPDLSALAIKVASDTKHKSPGDIRLAAFGLIAL